MAVPTGFEPAISCVTGRHVRQLHHGTILVTPAGFEPGTSGLKVLRPDRLDKGAMSALLPELRDIHAGIGVRRASP